MQSSVHDRGDERREAVPRTVPFSNPNSPEATGGGFTGNMFGIMKLVQNRGPSAHARTPNQHRGNLQGYPAVIRSQGLVVA